MIVSSFPPPSFPPPSRFGEVFGAAFSVSIVSFVVSISMAKLFAKKHSYQLDSNQVHSYIMTYPCLFLSYIVCYMIYRDIFLIVLKNVTYVMFVVCIVASLCLFSPSSYPPPHPLQREQNA